METRSKRWAPLLALGLGLGLLLLLTVTLQVMAVEYKIVQTTLEDFNAGTLYHTALTREDGGEVRLLVIGIAGEWITDTNATGLPGLMGHCAVRHENTLYVVGGRSADASSEQEIYASTINTETHDLSNWLQTAALDATAYPYGLWKQGCAVVNDRLYVLGGIDGHMPPTVYQTVSFAPINSDGSLGAWQTTAPLPEKRYAAGVTVMNGRIYVLGGVYENKPRNQAWVARPDPVTGEISSWTTTAQLPEAGYYGHAVAADDNYLYVTGGTDTTSTTAGDMFPYVDFATPAADGSIASWQRTTDMAHNLFAHAAILLNSQLYTMGGAKDNALVASDYVGAAMVDPDGTLPLGWVNTSLIVPDRFWHAVVSSQDGWLYIIGGSSGGSAPIEEHIINRGATTGASGFEFAPWGTFTSHEIEIDPTYNRVLTGLSWTATISDTQASSLTMEYRYRPAGGAWSDWQGPFPSSSVTGTVTSTVPIDNARGRHLQYRATLSTTNNTTPILREVAIHYDIPEPPKLTKWADPPHGSLVEAGTIISYSISYYNKDLTPLTGVVITDFLPISTTLIPTSVQGLSPSIGSNYVQWHIDDLGPKQGGEVSFMVKIDENTPDNTGLSNFAVVASNEVGMGVSNGVQHTVGKVLYDLQLSASDNVTTVIPGQVVTYSITYTNANDYDWTVEDVVLTETIAPAGYVQVLGSAGWQEQAPGVYTLAVGDLSANASDTVEFVMQIDDVLPALLTAIANTVTIADNDVDAAEIILDNNQVEDVNLVAPLVYDLVVTKDDGAVVAAPGQTLNYTIVFTNQNAFDAPIDSVVLTETLTPADYLSYAGTDPSWQLVSPGVYRRELGTLAANQSLSHSFPVLVSEGLPVSSLLAITNTVQIGDPGIQGTEPATGNNIFHEIDIVSGPDLVVTDIDLHPAQPVPGQPLTVIATVLNQGLDATGYFYVELYAKDQDFVPAGPPDGALDHWGGCNPDSSYPNSGCARPEYLSAPHVGLEPGQSAEFTFQITLPAEGVYDFYAQADISFDVAVDPWGQSWGLVREGNERNNIGQLTGLPAEHPVIYLPLVLRQ